MKRQDDWHEKFVKDLSNFIEERKNSEKEV